MTLGGGDPAPAWRVSRWALPGELLAPAGDRPPRRTARDWAADTALFGVALLVWAWTWRDFLPPDQGYLDVVPGWMVTIDPWVGLAACAALWWRRRFPLGLALVMVPVLAVSGTAMGAVLVSVLTVAVHRGWLPATLVTGLQLAQALPWAFAYQPPGMSVTAYAVLLLLMLATPLGWGMAVRARRQLVVNLLREAQHRLREHEQRLVAARRAERDRIAREMHDVLAHRISLLSVHAGALSYRTVQAQAGAGPALAGPEVSEAVRVIRDSAHQALRELGEVLTVLRGEQDGADDAAGRGAPPPRLADIGKLVHEARGAGQQVTLHLDVDVAGSGPRDQIQRTAYRVVQEGLTNARKHAPDEQVEVRVRVVPGTGLEVAVTNPLPLGVSPAGIPGAGVGLTGLAERVQVDGGALEHGPAGGVFRLAARLPWQL